MLKIRLARVGRRNQPIFRVVVTEKSQPAKSGYLESLGTYDPVKKNFEVDEEKIEKWLNDGAQPSDTVHNLLVKNKVIEGEKKRTTKEAESPETDKEKVEEKDKETKEEGEEDKEKEKDEEEQKGKKDKQEDKKSEEEEDKEEKDKQNKDSKQEKAESEEKKEETEDKQKDKS